MSTDYGEKERQFLSTLKADSGRDLDEWMRAIAAQGLTQRNDIIDWLRRQGFMFSKASWLERIHNNGGKPIYGEDFGARASAARRRHVRTAASPAPAAVTPVTPKPQEQAPAPVPATDGALEELLAKAKALRPLARFVLAEAAKAVPGAEMTAGLGHITISRGAAPFALLTVSHKELRLGLRLGDRPFDSGLQAARFTGPGLKVPASITHMIILDDARQVNSALIARIKEAASD